MGADKALGDFLTAHLQGEERYGIPLRRSVEGQVECERGLTDSRTCADDDQLALAQAHEHTVKAGITRRDTRGNPTGLADLFCLVKGLDQKVVQRLVCIFDLTVGHRQQHALRALNNLFGIGRSVIGKLIDLVGGADNLAQHGITANNGSMVLPVHERQRLAHELKNIGLAAYFLQLVLGIEVIDKRDRVDGHAAIVHIVHGLEQRLVHWTIKIVGEKLGKRLLHNLTGEKHGREHVCLCVRVIGKALMRPALGNRQVHAHSFFS